MLRGLVFVFILGGAGVNTKSWGDCGPKASDEPVLYASVFKWGLSLVELQDLFKKVYSMPDRLTQRAYIDSEKSQIVLPYFAERGGAVRLPLSFARVITSHIEKGFKQKVIDGVFFADMGHSHLFLPQKDFANDLKNIEVPKMSRFYEKMLTHPDTKHLYHTAEQLKVLDANQALIADPYLQWRFKTRNLVGPNNVLDPLIFIQNLESPANTAHELEDHFYWGAGINLSANSQGCFSYTHNNQEFRYDLSLYDLPYPDGTVLIHEELF